MCWCLRVYWTVLHNLFVRFVANVANFFYNNNYCCCDCCGCCQKYKQAKRASSVDGTESGFDPERLTLNFQHDYVIVDDIDANYLEIERRKIETETYYRTVDRATAEDILSCREDGACLVRPYKEADISIKYIVSVAAEQQYFHLFIRQKFGTELYCIGQEKKNERLFHTPSDIIDFYSNNALQCTNKSLCKRLVLKPVVA